MRKHIVEVEGMSKLTEIIEHGDPAEIIGVALNARMSRDEGLACDCPEPALVGFDLMCGNCLLENEGQRDRKLAAMSAPHPFEVRVPGDALDWMGMCSFCTRWRDDPRHTDQPREEAPHE